MKAECEHKWRDLNSMTTHRLGDRTFYCMAGHKWCSECGSIAVTYQALPYEQSKTTIEKPSNVELTMRKTKYVGTLRAKKYIGVFMCKETEVETTQEFEDWIHDGKLVMPISQVVDDWAYQFYDKGDYKEVSFEEITEPMATVDDWEKLWSKL